MDSRENRTGAGQKGCLTRFWEQIETGQKLPQFDHRVRVHLKCVNGGSSRGRSTAEFSTTDPFEMLIPVVATRVK